MDKLLIKKKNEVYLQVFTDPGTGMELSDFFTFYVPGYKFMPAYKNKIWDGKIRLYNQLTKELYIGLLPYIKEFAEVRQVDIEYEMCDRYGLPEVTDIVNEDTLAQFIESLNLHSRNEKIAPRDYQLNAIKHAMATNRAVLLSPTASGKSLIIYILTRLFLDMDTGQKALIVVPTTSLVEQMTSDFLDYSSYDESFGPEDIHKIYSGKEKITNNKVIITTWQSIYKLPSSWFEQFGMVVGDEAHTFKAKSLTSILEKLRDCKYRYGLTGTLDGTQTHRLVLEGLFGQVFKVTTTRDLIDAKSLADLKITVLLLKYLDETRKKLTKSKYNEEVDFIVTNQARNRFIRNLAISLEGNTLVLFQFVEKHGIPLYNNIKEKIESIPKNQRKVFFVSGATDVDTRENVRAITEKEKDAIIVASSGTFSTGINIRNIHNIIFASPSKSQVKVLQSIGRGLRKSDDGRGTNLYDLADDLHWKSNKNYTLQHAAERIKIYTREKFDYKIVEVDLND
jgi:superfamily II DNA or RNA helicase